MHASSTIDYDCPDWCERTDHHADDLSDGSPAYHYGPEFGVAGIQREGDGPFAIVLLESLEGGMFIPADDTGAVFNMARDLTLAANWIELHR